MCVPRHAIPRGRIARGTGGEAAVSLINQMLQNLEKRGGSAEESAGLPPEVRISPVASPSPSRRRLLLLVLGLGLAMGGAIVWLPGSTPPVAVSLPPPAPPVSPAPVAEAASPTASPMPVAMPTPAVMTDAEPALQSSATLSTPLVPPPTPEPVKDALPVSKEAGRPPVVTAEKAVLPPAPVPAKPRIEETPPLRPTGIAKTVPVENGEDVAERIYRQAIDVYSQGRTSESLSLARQAVTASPQHQAARQLLVRQLIEQRDLGQASAELRDGIRMIPGQWAWYAWLARLEMERGDLPAARQVVEDALAQAGNNADILALAGAIAQRQGRSSDAAEHYRAALRLKPAEGRSWVGLGLALEAEGHGQEAREAFRRALNSPGLSPELQGLAQRKLR